MNNVLEELRWKKFPVLDNGHVCLVDVMGDDYSVVQAARISYGEGTKHISDDRALIRYLLRQHHTSPFEMCELKLRIRTPIDCWRQWIRHRTANVNEYSTRYSKAINEQQRTQPTNWRAQSKTNKQGSGEYLISWPDDWTIGETDSHWTIEGPQEGQEWSFKKGEYESPPTIGEFLTYWEEKNQGFLRKDYDIRLQLGVAREQARKDLPLSTYTEAYWKIDLHNLLHFLKLRTAQNAQEEIRRYAVTIGEKIVKPLFPIIWEAFNDYRINATVLTGLDTKVIQTLAKLNGTMPFTKQQFLECQHKDWRDLKRCRERDECLEKLITLGIVNADHA